MAFWRYLRVGALPAALELYDEDVIAAVGAATVGGMIAAQQQAVATVTLNVTEVERIGMQSLVVAETVPEVGYKARVSFFLSRDGGRWRITYDTFSANALQAFVQQRVQRRIDPNAEEPSPEAVRAGEEVAERYRRVSLTPDARRSGARRRAPRR